MRRRENLVDDDCGQDLTEYAVMLAFVVMVAAAFLLGSGSIGTSVFQIWNSAGSDLAAGNSADHH